MNRAAAHAARLLTLALTVAQLACPGPGDFRCHSHNQCGAKSFCEVDGRCSVSDPLCSSGRRYRPREGDLSNQCVGDSCPDNPLVSLVAGTDHACALRANRRVACWGRNDEGQLGDGSRTAHSLPVTVEGLPELRAVAAGARHTCAVALTGEVFCWGAGEAGQLGGGAGDVRPQPIAVAGVADAVSVAAGANFSCAVLGSGAVSCWGANGSGQLGDGGPRTTGREPTPVFALSSVRALSAHGQHACALRYDETLWCWGAGAQGQLGDGAARDAPQPVRVAGLDAVTAVATGLLHTCAATRAEGLYCWGANTASQLGREASVMEPRPTAVPTVTNPVEVAAGDLYTCAIRQGGALFCWGGNASGQLGDGSTSTLPLPVRVSELGPATEVVAGGAFTCARAGGGAVFCWGDDRHGQLGLGKTTSRPLAAPVPGIGDAVDLAAGAHHTCVVTNTPGADTPAQLACWGENQAGQLGDGTTVDHPDARAVKGIEAVSVAAGVAHSCAIVAGGALFCWGRGGSGQLGGRRAVDTPSPATVPLAAGARVVGVALGEAHTCAALDDGTARCWGTNLEGQLGDGTMTSQFLATAALPVGGMAAPLGGIDMLSAGDAHTCARLDDGGLRCWGRGTNGQLGGGVGTQASPVIVEGVTLPARAVAAGAAHTCALDGGGEIMCWGGGGAPMHVATNGGAARAIAAGRRHTCAVVDEGRVVCWGENDVGQLGDGTTKLRLSPVHVAGLTDVEQLGAGAAHTCARRKGGSVWCWGGNFSGQLGDDSPLIRTAPQLARLACQ